MNRIKKISTIILSLICLTISNVFLYSHKVNAYSENSEAWKKSIGTAIRNCYAQGIMKSPLAMEDYDFNGNALNFGSDWARVPNLNGNDRSIECYDLFKKYIKDWPKGDPDVKSNFLVDNLGYTKTNKKTTGECFYFRYNYVMNSLDYWENEQDQTNNILNVPTDYVCADTINSDGTIGVDELRIQDTDHRYGGGSYNLQWESSEGSLAADCKVQWPGGVTSAVKFQKNKTHWADFKRSVTSMIMGSPSCVSYHHSFLLDGYTMNLQPNFIGTELLGDVASVFEIKDKSVAASKATKSILGVAYPANPAFSATDTFSLYQAYVSEYYKADIVCSTKEKPMTDNEKTAKKTLGYYPIAVFSNGTMQTDCYASATENSEAPSTGAEFGKYGEDRTFAEICDWLAKNHKNINTGALESVATKDKDASGTLENNAEDAQKSEAELIQEGCFRNAGSMGWIICPAIFGLRNVGDSIYKTIEPMLQVDDSIVKQLGKQNSSLFDAWSTFRNFANIVFVILFLVIIFSQVTGYGIDNYGIKKTLPKLIITVILVNLSFILCAIAVDISNIIGSSIKGLFEGLGNKSKLGGSAVESNSYILEKIFHYLVLAAGAGGAGAAAIALTGWAIIIPILLFVLTTAISILFAFIVLGMRQALIIVLIVSAPIAIVLSGFPNTKTIYNKWFGLFKGVLMVYPIIGLLVGAGYFTATVIYSGNSRDSKDFIMAIVAGLLSVIPYFMIPSLTRKSLDAVGSLGTKINGFGNKLGQGAKGRINNLQPIKDVKSNSIASRARARATKFMTSDKARAIEDDIKNGKKVSLRRANKYARAAELASTDRNAILAARVAESKYNRLQSGSGFNAALASAADAEDTTEVKNYETLIRNGEFIDSNGKRVEYQDAAAVESALQQELMKDEGSVDTKKIRALQNILASKGDDGRNRIYDAMKNAQENGSVSKNAIKAFSSNIMNNQGDYKNQHRSLYEFAKATAADGFNNTDKHDGKSDISSFRTDGIQALTADSFLSADRSQIEAYRKAYDEKKLSAEDRAKLEQVAHSIANNRDVHSKIRTDDYGRALSTFASDVDWKSVYSGDLKVDHSGDNNGGGNGGGSGGNGGGDGGNGGNGGGSGNNNGGGNGGNGGGSGNSNGGGNGGGNGDGDNNGPPIPPDVPPPEWRNQP